MQILQSTANWRLPVLIALLLTPVALVTHGYYFAKQDQRLHIPFIYRTIDPALYPNDYLFDQRQANISLSEYVFVWPVSWLGIEWAMFLAYILAQMAILLGIYILARHLVSPISAYLAMLFFLIPMQVGGTEIRTYENYFNPRTLVLPLTLLILTMLWKQNVWIAAILVCLQLLFHPISGLPIWIVMMLFLLSWFWQGFLPKRSLIMATGLLIFTLGLMIWRSSGENQLWLDPTWRDILDERTPFLFLSNWRTHQWLSLVTFFLLGIVGWSGRPRDIKTTELSIFVLVVVLGLTVAVILGVDWFGFALLLQLQLGRSWQLVGHLSRT